MRLEASGKPSGCKLLRVSADLESGLEGIIVLSLSVRGDFFAVPEEGFEEAEASLERIPLDGLGRAFDAAMEGRKVSLAGISGAAVEQVLKGGLVGR